MITMKLIVFYTLSLTTFITDTFQKNIQLPDVYWHPDEPMFNTKKCLPVSTTIYVKEFDTMNVICPNRDLNNAILDKMSRSKSKYNYNLLMTEDKELFKERKKRTGNKEADTIFICREHKTLGQNGLQLSVIDKYRIQFSPIRASSSQPEFKAGHTYYFYTTSNGTEASLGVDSGSASTKHMFFKVEVCSNDDQICKDRDERINRCIERRQVKQPQVSDEYNSNGKVNWEILVPVLVVLFFVVGILVGALTPSFIEYMRNRRKASQLRTQESVSTASTSEKGGSSPCGEESIFLQKAGDK
ncbi:uncharacterized protein [Clytia hemisphaerica]|uniref:uncharacterized protein n=1 Tax=Clytia hemisphaerica TaxID=252671 RepID=UPI0034D4D52A